MRASDDLAAYCAELLSVQGCAPFTYTAKGRGRVALGYRAAPAEAMDSPAAMRPWAQLAREAALRARSTSLRA